MNEYCPFGRVLTFARDATESGRSGLFFDNPFTYTGLEPCALFRSCLPTFAVPHLPTFPPAALLLSLIEVNLRYAHSNFVRKLLGPNYIDATLFRVKSDFPNTGNQMGAVNSVLEQNLELAISRLLVTRWAP